MADNETEVVRPLDSAEIKDAITQAIAEKVRESLNTTCWLYGSAWPKFKATWRVDVTMANMYDEETETFVQGKLLTHEISDTEPVPVLVGGEMRDPMEIAVSGEIPYTPPNVVRKRHGMPIPTVVKRDDGSTEQKAVVFRQTRNRGYRPTEVE